MLDERNFFVSQPGSSSGSFSESNLGGIDLASIVDARLDRKKFQDHHWTGTFWEYLDIVAVNPSV
ncbi:MAG TPA: hypothetical protein VF777_04930, partial [Phycisphaerales bacterium]